MTRHLKKVIVQHLCVRSRACRVWIGRHVSENILRLRFELELAILGENTKLELKCGKRKMQFVSNSRTITSKLYVNKIQAITQLRIPWYVNFIVFDPLNFLKGKLILV